MTRFKNFQNMSPAEQTSYGKGVRAAGEAKIIVRLRKKAKNDPKVEKEYVEELKKHCEGRRIH